MGVMSIMDSTGDKKELWNPENQDEVASARATFNKLRGKGYLAYKVRGKDGDKGEQITEFDPDAGALIMAPPMAGG